MKQLQMFGAFMAEHGVPILNEAGITKEEGTLILLVVCFTQCADSSEEGSSAIRQARSKYINILKSYHQEMFPAMTDEEKVKRFRLLLDFIAYHQVLLNLLHPVTILGASY